MPHPLTAEHAESFDTNRASWDERVEAHWASRMYRRHADALRQGRPDLAKDLVAAAGDVTGRSLIQLQCHMGMETMGWSLLGARAVGVDFSAPAIAKAEQLCDELQLDTRFVCANVYDVPEQITETFDYVFVSIGSLCWLPDVRAWASVVAGLLNPGGRLVLNDVHPLMNILDDADDPPGFALRYPYLGGEPVVCEETSTYADLDRTFEKRRVVDWTHPLGDVVTAVVDAGLRVERLTESSRCVWPALNVMTTEDDGRTWRFPEPWRGKLPVEFTLLARQA